MEKEFDLIYKYLRELKSLVVLIKKSAEISIKENATILPSDFVASIDLIIEKILNLNDSLQKIYKTNPRQ